MEPCPLRTFDPIEVETNRSPSFSRCLRLRDSGFHSFCQPAFVQQAKLKAIAVLHVAHTDAALDVQVGLVETQNLWLVGVPTTHSLATFVGVISLHGQHIQGATSSLKEFLPGNLAPNATDLLKPGGESRPIEERSEGRDAAVSQAARSFRIPVGVDGPVLGSC